MTLVIKAAGRLSCVFILYLLRRGIFRFYFGELGEFWSLISLATMIQFGIFGICDLVSLSGRKTVPCTWLLTQKPSTN